MWKQIILKLLDGVQNIPSPFDSKGTIEFVFVILDTDSRMGFMWAWCSATYRGVNVSRMKIPENVHWVTSDEFSKMNIPEIIFETPI